MPITDRVPCDPAYSVLIIGNHSAGKSSFINWYIGEDIQRTGVAIETRGFTFVTSGRYMIVPTPCLHFFANISFLIAACAHCWLGMCRMIWKATHGWQQFACFWENNLDQSQPFI